MRIPRDPVSSKNGRLAGLSLICLGVEAGGPFLRNITKPVAGIDPVVATMGFRVFFLLLALLLGIFGRRARAGRVGLIGSAMVLAAGLLLVLFLVSRTAIRARTSPQILPSPP
jgi:hypothetical protein